MRLQIKQKTHDGRTKTWKVDPKSTLVTMGTSRKSDLVSIDRQSSTFDVAFEYRQDGWHFIQFGTQHTQPDILIKNNDSYKLGESDLSFTTIELKPFVYEMLDGVRTNGKSTKKLLIVSKNQRVIDVQVKNPNESLYATLTGNTQALQFNTLSNESWAELEVDGLNYKCKLVSLEEADAFTKVNPKDYIDKESKNMLIATLAVAFLFIFIGVMTPKSNMVTAEIQLPKSTQSAVIKFETPKPKKTQPAVAKAVAQPKEAQSAPASASSGGRVSALLKGAVGIRISQLMGKVSATDARTTQVLVTSQGRKADDGASGRALAAVGNVDTSGRNWNGEATATGGGKGISTAGVGGGKSGSGLGNGLAAGKTGSGGVGLIEEESEVIGGLDREVIAQYIKTQLGQILYCYERQLSANPELYGKVAVKFIIAGTGQVESQLIGQTTLNSVPVEGCILNKISKWKFPEPRGGTKVVVTYPFLFKSTN